jgi:hypothetical protein
MTCWESGRALFRLRVKELSPEESAAVGFVETKGAEGGLKRGLGLYLFRIWRRKKRENHPPGERAQEAFFGSKKKHEGDKVFFPRHQDAL